MHKSSLGLDVVQRIKISIEMIFGRIMLQYLRAVNLKYWLNQGLVLRAKLALMLEV